MGAGGYEGRGVGVSVTSCDLTDLTDLTDIRTLIVCELLAYKVGMRICRGVPLYIGASL